jgi:putative NADH-flavin reductase
VYELILRQSIRLLWWKEASDVKIAVIGANGKTGRLVVGEALARGHEVIAVVRDPAGVRLKHERLQVARADARDAVALTQALVGAEAVVSTLGRSSQGKPLAPVFAAAMQATLAAIEANGAQRLSVISAQGVGEESDEGLGLTLRLMRRLLGKAIDDMREMERLVKASDLEWTIARAGGLTNQPKGHYLVELGNALKGHGRTRRADLAEVLVLAVTEERWPRQAVVVAS